MFGNSVAFPTSINQFRELWGWDAEFCPNGNHCPDSVTLFAKEIRSGREIRMTRRDLLAADRLPFGTESDVAVESYSAVAELSCCQALGLPMPRNVLCTYAETIAAINGQQIDGLTSKRPSLLEACDLYDIPHMDKAHKDTMRDLILGKGPDGFSPEELQQVEEYNADDVKTDIALFAALAPAIDVPAALVRGRFSKAVAAMEASGIQIDVERTCELHENWDALRMHYIARNDHLHLYDEAGHFHEDRFAALIEARRWPWPRTATGKPEMASTTLSKMARRYPELQPFQRLRDQIAELRLGAFLNTIGADGSSRCPLMPFWSRTGRNQPQGAKLAFLLSLPAWTHGLIKPREGWGVAYLDWVAQEVGIGAGLSGDPAMIEDYRSGDPHLRFAIRFGLAPEGATKESHRAVRDSVKPVVLGIAYGISKWGVAAQTGKSHTWAAGVISAYRHFYPTFAKWQHDTASQAMFDRKIVSPLGFPMAVHGGTPKRTLINYLHQASGADMMRLAAIAAHEAGIQVLCPVHDAFWIAAPLKELDDAVATMTRIMIRASTAVTGGLEIPVEVSARVEWPNCFGDVRKGDAKGSAMWREIQELVRGELLNRRSR